MHCTFCEKTIPDESAFCLFCGAQLSQEVVAAGQPLAHVQESLFYPNLIGRFYLLALEKLIGRRDLDTLLAAANLGAWRGSYPPRNLQREFPFAHMAAIAQATETIYGASRARELGMASGSALFTACRDDFGPLLKLFTILLRIVPTSRQLHLVVNSIAKTFSRFSDQPTHVEKRAGQLFYVVNGCAVCWGRQLDRPSCHLMQGMLEEASRWATGGALIRIEEIECRGSGGATCTFVIDLPTRY